MTHSFQVILVPQAEGGFFVDCPSLQGCHSQGESIQEALENIQEAILLTLEDMRAHAEAIPHFAPPLITQVLVDV